MESKRISFLGWLICLVYGLLLTAVLLWVRFPTAKARAYLADKVATAIPGASMKIGTCNYAFPVSFLCDRLTFSGGNGADEVARLDHVRITPVPTGLGFQYQVAGDVYGGTFAARLRIAPVDGRVALEDLELTHVGLDHLPWTKEMFRREVLGLLDFHGDWSTSLKGPGNGTLQGSLSVRDGGFSLRSPILLAKQLEMTPLEVEVAYDKGVLKLTKGTLKGKELNADFDGKLRLTGDLTSWELDLGGTLRPQNDYLGSNPRVVRMIKRMQRDYRMNEITYRLTGSLGSPRFRYGKQ